MQDQSITYKTEMDEWESNRLKALKKADGYLSLIGLCWLTAGENSFGSGSNHPCQFPAGLPADIGCYHVTDSAITVDIHPDAAVTHKGEPVANMPILTDRDQGGPTVLELGSVSWFVIKRGEALGIRIRDSKSDLLSNFAGVDRFPRNEAWRITGKFKKYDQPRTVPIPTILGTDADMISPGILELTINGESRSLVGLKSAEADRLFLIVADGLAGKETYGGGRFLTTEPISSDGSVVVDFNKATNPPCAFTPWATCPRPPDENRFTVDIPAGEKVYK